MALALPALVVAGGAGAYGAYVSWSAGELIAPNVFIAGVPVGGLNKYQARQRLHERFGRLFVTLKTSERPFKVSLTELGGNPAIEDVVAKSYSVGREGGFLKEFLNVYGSKAAGRHYALPIQWQKAQLKRKLYIVDRLYRRQPHNARLKVTEAGVQIVPETLGRGLNVGETALQLQKRYFIALPKIEAATRALKPRLLAADLEGSDVELGRYTTRFNPGERGRTRNVRTAATSISGQVLMPGQAFSFNHATGERTAGKGYRMAHIFITKPGADEAEVADGLAGGTCQVSSTLFNAVRKTNAQFDKAALKILERNHHSLPVTYVPRGLDATVAWPGKDFRFRNAYSAPIFLKTAVNGSHLTVSVWARVPQNAAPPGSETPFVDGKRVAANVAAAG